ncbi:3-isopropylmalate dehydratase large subunit [Hoeflea prorocentri]|uniref:3-isopropylmalate dehydratase large subunit n=1 Tax=Hoeflea prorocentri TaxID=1922333 RepID=A0A9X3UNL8_9HYPH|nr:3-isopropylmalate dehydratase large subunit [Hoeflea prorocentri]MCY6383705.1 3-isopropylmalate dehydratase large subunit [Hoeflea prorocentri]MDA5401505.1 3-isopropylmalate dehydratase large subunit [Hoeflea prorocentri]
MARQTLYDKIWQSHTVRDYGGGNTLLYIDRHLVQEVSSPQAFAALDAAGRAVRRPDAHIAVADHAVPTKLRAFKLRSGQAAKQVRRLEENAARHNIPYIEIDDDRHGIVHVIGPELGFTLPGTTLVCGDSHTCTHGAFGCIAFGIGTSECATVLATQTLHQKKQKRMRVILDGGLAPGVTVKDVILALIAEIGTGGGAGYAVEFAGSTVDAMSMYERMTLCNMAIEAGSRVGLIAVDETTIRFLKDRPLAPKGDKWDAAVAAWTALKSDPDAQFDRQVNFETSNLAPQISWGTSPEETLPVTAHLPDPEAEPDPVRRARIEKSLNYMALKPGMALRNIPIDRVFIGSCTNGRIDDLRSAAKVVKGRKVAAGVSAIVVPGSAATRIAAEEEGLHDIFLSAGFEWRDAGCSMCVGMNDDRLSEGERCASTSNRNFEGRQGRGGRTHLMSPKMAAAAAVAGHLTDVREMM